ncbi:hypothetical protein [Corynebacterium glyciniphilum]|uniref:hypothetical protein n=1 Tax=Corynebacterium glyciniphilum TaxID=1404244 RepID=UPI003FCEEAA9
MKNRTPSAEANIKAHEEHLKRRREEAAPQIIRTPAELRALDRDTVIEKPGTVIRTARQAINVAGHWGVGAVLPAVVVATGEHLRACREALEGATVSHTPRARIKHQCDCCHGTIWPGETYHRDITFDAGQVLTWKACAECEDILPEVYWRAGYPDEGVNHDDYYEWAEETDTLESQAYLHRREHGRPEPKGETT